MSEKASNKFRILVFVGATLVVSLAVFLLTADQKKLERSVLMVTSLKFNQVVELMSGIGEVGVLADGTDAKEVVLETGQTVPRAMGVQPLEARPLPRLPMPDHPFMLDEYASGGVHADNYNSSVSPLPGPRGIKPKATVVQVMDDEIGMCTPLMRDLEDRLASVCISLGGPSKLVLFDPKQDFKILATADIPKRRGMLDPSGGWYSRMDNLGRPVVPTPNQDIRVFEVKKEGDEHRWHVAEHYDLSSVLPEDVSPSDVVPDWEGNYWFISGFAHVGHLDRETKKVKVIELGDGDETIGAALTVGREGAYILTSRALYLMDVKPDGTPYHRWRWDYGEAGGVDLSTPTLMDEGRLIAFSIDGIGDRAQVMVLKTADEEMTDEARVVCRFPVFKPGKSSIKNTLMAYGRSIVAQNNFGGEFFELLDFEPGLARVDVREDLSGCDLVWEDYTIASQVPPRLSTGDGHVYLYSHRRGMPDDAHAYYLTALDFHTGKVSSELFIGSGEAIDNPMLSVDFWPGGVAVMGIRNGIVTLRDTE